MGKLTVGTSPAVTRRRDGGGPPGLPKGLVEVVRRWPLSAFLGVHLGPLVILPALIKQEPHSDLVVGVAAIAWFSCFSGESLMMGLGPTGRALAPSPRLAKFVLFLGILAHVFFWVAGGNTYAVQLGLRESSWIASAASPFRVLAVLGAALVLNQARLGGLTKRQGLVLVGGAAGVVLFLGALGGIVGGAAGTASAILVVAALSSSIGKRGLVIGLVGLIALWPALFVVRESARAASLSSIIKNDGPGPWERLQMDEQFAMVQHADSLRAVGRPSAPMLVRAAIVPRFLDSSRPPLDTAIRMNQALGGGSRSARSATFFGNVFILDGWRGVVLVAGALGALSRLICLRLRSSPFLLALFGLLYQSCVSVNGTYPEGLVGFGQGASMLAAVWLLCHVAEGPRAGGRRGRGLPEGPAGSLVAGGGRGRPPSG